MEKETPTSFSDFFTKASPEERKKVMREVMREANEEQRKQLGTPTECCERCEEIGEHYKDMDGGTSYRCGNPNCGCHSETPTEEVNACSGNQYHNSNCDGFCDSLDTTPTENLNQACVRVLKEMTKETPECCTDTCGKERPNWLGRIPITPDPETPEHDKYNCEECRENMREYTKETPYEKLKRETDELETDKLNRIDKGMYEASGGTPTECPDCKCTNLVSDQCKGECLCHHPELTPTEEWEKEAILEWLKEERADGNHVGEIDPDKPLSPVCLDGYFDLGELASKVLSSHDAKWQQHEHDMYESLEKAHKEELAELVRKIEGTLLTILVRSGDRKTLDEYIRRDAVLALLNNK